MLEHKARIVSCIQRFVEEQLLPAVSFPNMVLDIAMAYPKHEGDDFKVCPFLISSCLCLGVSHLTCPDLRDRNKPFCRFASSPVMLASSLLSLCTCDIQSGWEQSLLVLGSSRGLKTLPRFLVAPRSSNYSPPLFLSFFGWELIHGVLVRFRTCESEHAHRIVPDFLRHSTKEAGAS